MEKLALQVNLLIPIIWFRSLYGLFQEFSSD